MDRNQFVPSLASCSGGSSNVLPIHTDSTQSIKYTNPASSRTITINAPITTVGNSHVGMSYEKDQVPGFLSANVPAFISYAKRLGYSVLRIGGNTVETTIYNPNGQGSIAGEVSPRDIDKLAQTVKSMGFRCIYGVKVLNVNTYEAVYESVYAAKALGSNLLGIEMGNEPDLATSYSSWYPQYVDVANNIKLNIPGVKIVGPEYSWPGSSQLRDFVVSKPPVDLLSAHHYIGGANSATLNQLISRDPALQGYLSTMLGYAQQLGISYRLTEVNSFYGGGKLGLSNTQASALWAINFSFLSAMGGCAGIEFHGDLQGTYAPIFNTANSIIDFQPISYGMLLASNALVGQVHSASSTMNDQYFTQYAVTAYDGSVVIVLVNANTYPITASINPGRTIQSANVQYLTGPGLLATSGLTYCNATLNPDGSWNAQAPMNLHVYYNNGADVTIPGASAALIRMS